ncbi:sigma-70 family RNA polymerase sigma factor [Paenibacillus sp. CN-4]|uniref:sigma-70 family RNA polymerase sigma factor n=1 Tax=Paenibacillus nanchangensis TaxID=3348343 RepID=UPI00397D4F88
MEVIQGTTEPYRKPVLLRDSVLSAERFTQLYDMYYPRIYKYVWYRINDHYAAEDVCSLVFESVIGRYSSYSQDKAPFDVWLFAIARNAVTDYYRAQKKRSFFSLDSILDSVFSRPSPEELAIREDNNRALLKAMAKLRDKERNIIAMKYAAGLKHSEIAQIMGVSESQIGVVLFRSLKKLQKILQAGGFNHEQ